MKTSLASLFLSVALIFAVSCKSIPSEAKPPITYTANAEAVVKPDEVMITGGWLVEPGKRVYVLAFPTFNSSDSGSAENQNLSITGLWIQTSVNAFDGTSLAALNTDLTATSSFKTLPTQEYARLTNQDAHGTATVIQTWRSLTMSGSPVEFSTRSSATVLDSEGTLITPGIFVTFTPEISEDNQSLKLAVDATWIRP